MMDESLYEARVYIDKWHHVEGKDEQRFREYEELPERVKEAIDYLCDIGEVN